MALLHPHQVGAQLYTIRDFTTTSEALQHSLDRIASIGYQQVQFSAVEAMNGDHPAVPPALAKKWLDQHGLLCGATHRPWDSLKNRFKFEVEFHQSLGCTYAAIGSLPAGTLDHPEKTDQFFKQFQELASKYQEHNIQLGIHNHDWDIAAILLNAVPLEIQMELDVYWAIQAGFKPKEFLPKAKDLLDVVHLKDIPPPEAASPVKFAAVGEGELDWPSLIPDLQLANAKLFLVEQDLCPRDPFDCLRSSWNYLCL